MTRFVSLVLFAALAIRHAYGAETEEHSAEEHAKHSAPASQKDLEGDMNMDEHAGHDMSAMQPAMSGMFGGYPASREASGTSWQPDSAPHLGIHGMYGEWTTMTHGFANLIY